MCIEFGPVRVDSVRRGGPGSNPPCAGSRRHGLLIACYLSFTPSSLKYSSPYGDRLVGLDLAQVEHLGQMLLQVR